MPSLKDLKNRISSVKSTQKITKAMQMVAAAKLRRAQDAAVAARPYAERMDQVLAGLGQAYAGRPDAPALLAGTGKDQTHLLVVATGERGLAGGFNSSIARLAREHANKLLAQGKTVKILCVGKKGADILRRGLKEHIVEVLSLRDVKQLGYGTAQGISEKVLSMYAAGEFDVATLFYAEFKSVVQQVPQALQLIPAKFEPAKGAMRPPRPVRRSTNTSRAKKRSSKISCRAISRFRSSAHSWKTTRRSLARRCRRWTMLPATPAR